MHIQQQKFFKVVFTLFVKPEPKRLRRDPDEIKGDTSKVSLFSLGMKINISIA